MKKSRFTELKDVALHHAEQGTSARFSVRLVDDQRHS
jgi:hypothetical protein